MVPVLVCRHSVDVCAFYAGIGLARVTSEIVLDPEGVIYCLRFSLFVYTAWFMNQYVAFKYRIGLTRFNGPLKKINGKSI